MNEYQEYFNKTASEALATRDKNVNPNVCLCGSALIIDENTIIAASGFFDQTEKNIMETNKAVFMAFQRYRLNTGSITKKQANNSFQLGSVSTVY